MHRSKFFTSVGIQQLLEKSWSRSLKISYSIQAVFTLAEISITISVFPRQAIGFGLLAPCNLGNNCFVFRFDYALSVSQCLSSVQWTNKSGESFRTDLVDKNIWTFICMICTILIKFETKLETYTENTNIHFAQIPTVYPYRMFSTNILYLIYIHFRIDFKFYKYNRDNRISL